MVALLTLVWNIGVVYCLGAIFYFGVIDYIAVRDPIIRTELWGYWIYIVVFVVVGTAFFSLTRYGNWLLRLSLNLRKPTKKEENLYQSGLDEMLKKISLLERPKKLKITVLIADKPTQTAAAVGNTIIIYRGLLRTASEEQIKGVLAHELGHIYNNDTKKLATIVVSNFYSRILTVILDKIIIILSPKGRGMIAFFLLIIFVPMQICLLIIALFNWLVAFLYKITSRKKEYKADLFAIEMEAANGLCSFLESIQDLDIRGDSFLEKYMASHPPTALRVEKIEDALESSSN